MVEINHQTTRAGNIVTMLVAAVIISTSSVWVKVADMGASSIGFYRMFIGGLFLVALCVIKQKLLWRNLNTVKWLFFGALFFAADLRFWHRSIQYVGPGLATVLGNVQVFFMTLFGYLFFKEAIGLKFFMGLVFTFMGLFLLVGLTWGGLTPDYKLGVFYGLATALAYTGFMLCLRHAQSLPNALSPTANLGVLSIICAFILFLVVLIEGGSLVVPNMKSWVSVLALGILCQVIGWVLITKTMPHLPTSIVGLLLLLQPAMSMTWDVLFFNRPTDWVDGIGLGLVLGGIYLATMKNKKTKPH